MEGRSKINVSSVIYMEFGGSWSHLSIKLNDWLHVNRVDD